MKKIFVLTYRISVTPSCVTDKITFYFSSRRKAQAFIDNLSSSDFVDYIDIHLESVTLF